MPNYVGIDELKNKITTIKKSPILKRAKDLLTEEQSKMLSDAMTIVNKYKDPSWAQAEYLSIQTDVLCLQSIVTTLATNFGDIMSLQETDSTSLYTSRSKIRLDAKQARKDLQAAGSIVKATIEDIKDLSYAMTEDEFNTIADAKTVGDHIRFVYFALKDQVQLLEKAAARFYNKGER